jgi:hypothetical protein
MFMTSDILSAIAATESENSGEQMKTAVTNRKRQIADLI